MRLVRIGDFPAGSAMRTVRSDDCSAEPAMRMVRSDNSSAGSAMRSIHMDGSTAGLVMRRRSGSLPPVIAPPPAHPPATFDFDMLVDDPLIDPAYND